MGKLQLYIAKSGNIYKSIFNLNPDEDVYLHVRDLTDAVCRVKYDPSEKSVFYLLTTIDKGFFITVLRTIPPKEGHHLAAWIFIPKGLEISPDSLDDIVRLTTRKMSNAEVTADDVAALREAFGREYASTADVPFYLSNDSESDTYAWRNYGGNSGLTLRDFCGEGIWQLSYAPYKGVLLLDAELGYNVEGKSLNGRALAAPALLLPAEGTEAGFTAYVFGRPLDRPVAANIGATVPVTWHRSGFDDVTVDCRIDTETVTPEPPVTTDSQKMLTPDEFVVTSHLTREPLHNCVIRVNGIEIVGSGHAFTVDELRKAAVLVTADGHFPFSGEMDLASTTRALIQLQERRRIYRFELPVVSSSLGAPVKFEIQSKHAITESPIEGYAIMGEVQEGQTRMNHLGFVGPDKSLPAKLLYAAIGLVAGILVTFAAMQLFGGSKGSTMAPAANPDSIVAVKVPVATAPQTPAIVDAPQPAEATAEANENAQPAQVQADSQPVADINAAIKYLDDNKVWTREDLEKYSALQGLYDDMNNYRIDRLIDVWGPKLKASERMAKVAEHAALGKRKKKPEGPYNADNDTRIAVQSYLNRIDP